MGERHNVGIAILASGNGTTAEDFIRATQDRDLNLGMEVGLVITDNPNAGVLGKVAQLNAAYGLDIQTQVINGKLYPGGRQKRGQTMEEAATINGAVSTGEYGLVALLGYTRIIAARGGLMQDWGWLPEYGVEDSYRLGVYRCRMLNTHPGPLPETADTHGLSTHARVMDLAMDSKLAYSAQTLHCVSAEVDEGPVYATHVVDIPVGATALQLAAHVQRVEKAHLPLDISRFLSEQRVFMASVRQRP